MIRNYLYFYFPLLLLSACSPQPQKLAIAAAANVQFAMNDILKEFTRESGIQCEMIMGSSGKLMAQIQAGAPYDVFVSADMKYPDVLYKAGLTTRKPEVYAYGVLVLWTLIDDIIPSMDILDDNHVTHIAIANPESAPYGEAAVEALKANGVYELVLGKLVYGESVAQVNQFIVSRTAEIGFTSMSVVTSMEMKNKGRWIEVERIQYNPIAQGAAVILHKGRDMTGAEEFYKFLFSAKAGEILKKSGYIAVH